MCKKFLKMTNGMVIIKEAIHVVKLSLDDSPYLSHFAITESLFYVEVEHVCDMVVFDISVFFIA